MVWTKKDLCGLFTISYHVGFWVEPDTSLDRLPTKHKTLGMRCSFHRLRFHPVFCSVLVRASRRGASCGTRNGRLRCHCPGVRLRSLSCGAASSFHVVYKHLFRHRPVPCKWCLGWHKQLRDALGLQLAVCHTMGMACSYLHRDLLCARESLLACENGSLAGCRESAPKVGGGSCGCQADSGRISQLDMTLLLKSLLLQ